jgi:hypothetical protein
MSLIESLNTDKLDTDKIKSLILFEQDVILLKDRIK